MYKVEIYKTDRGKEPFVDWKNCLELQIQARIDARLTRLQMTENFGDFHSIQDGVLELRLDFGPGYRIYFGKSEKKLIILLLGGSKRSQVSDIQKAKKYWQDYLSKKRGHHDSL
jgi:putative addiction module killer protein